MEADMTLSKAKDLLMATIYRLGMQDGDLYVSGDGRLMFRGVDGHNHMILTAAECCPPADWAAVAKERLRASRGPESLS